MYDVQCTKEALLIIHYSLLIVHYYGRTEIKH